MKYAVSLIDKASKICGGDAALARRLKISRAAVSLMRSGERAVTPEIAAEMADIAGDDARQALIDTVIERNAGTAKGPLLRAILGKALAAGVAAMWLISYSSDSPAATKLIANDGYKPLTSYTSYLFSLLRRLRRSVTSRQRPKYRPAASSKAAKASQTINLSDQCQSAPGTSRLAKVMRARLARTYLAVLAS